MNFVPKVKKDKDTDILSIVVKQDNADRLRFVSNKFGITMSRIVDGLLDDFFYKFRREMDEEEFLKWFEKYITEKKLLPVKEPEKKKGWF